ncbi:MAG: dihydrolipoamide acetyltransferase [Monoraphidium minutum]|nr:MAG: dihydrolipoamide acetyltransferase [Monoraphidium minutum]
MKRAATRLLACRGILQARAAAAGATWPGYARSPALQPGLPLAWGVLARGYADLPAHTQMLMPSLSPTMTQGNIAAWRKKEGATIAPGDVLAEVETDKATIEWEAQEEGFLAKIIKGDGSKDIPVGEAVAILVEEEGDIAAFANYSGGASPAAAAPSAPPPQQQQQKPAAPTASSFPPHDVLAMPALSPTMAQGNILEWRKAVGDEVAAGDVLCEVETDKATISWESQEEGYVAAILLPGGSKDIPIGTPAAVLVEDKAHVAAFASYSAADAAGAAAAPAPAASAPPPPKPAAAAAPAAPATPPAAAPRAAAAPGGRVAASPYARKLALDAGVSLAGAAGTGPGGRVTAADVQQLIASGGAPRAGGAPAAPAGAPAAAGPAGGEWTDETVSQVKRVTAARLLESKQTVPHYYLTMEVEVDALMALRGQVNKQLGADGVKLSVNDFIVKAAALALRKVPAMNSSWMGDFVRTYHNVDINVAVQTPGGLMVPFVADADAKGLAAISAEVRALAAKAKAGKLQPSEFMGGTFTISNLGMFGIRQFAAIVNPPQAAILAVGAAAPKLARGPGGELKEVQSMFVTLSCDHRVVDGAVGAEWLQAFKGHVESPLTMMV